MKIKKLAAVILAVSVMASCITGAMAENDIQSNSDVEISFKVGDENLSINGNFVTVEKPFVAGEGTTLVPLRVITEAFGAKVDWEDSTQTITLTYPDVSIILQIGNKIAKINDHAESLAEAPVLSKNDVTMVPLRFISESFGAAVSYDDATEGITVIKKFTNDEATVMGTTELPRVGDSYFGWVIDTPKSFLMSSRAFDGSYTYFTDDYGNEICVDIYEADEDKTFDEYFSDVKNSFSGITLAKADKLTDKAGNKYMHFQAKQSGELLDLRIWLKDEREFILTTTLSADADDETKKTCLSLADTFEVFGKFDNNVYDLSDVKDGYREFKSEEYKLSFKVPAGYYQDFGTDGENAFAFLSYGGRQSYIHMGVYSKSDSITAEKLANSDREIHAKYENKAIASVSEVEAFSINGLSGYKYTDIFSNSVNNNCTMYDMFFEVGDYVYNFTVVSNDNDDKQIADTVIASLSVEELDKDKVGTILRNDPENIEKKVKCSSWSLTLPSMWEQVSESEDNGVLLRSRQSDAMASVVITYSSSASSASSGEDFKNIINDYSKKKDITVISQPKSMSYKNGTYYKAVIKRQTADEAVYETVYFRYYDGYVITLTLMESEIYYSGASDEEFEEIVKSFEIF